MFRRVLTTSLLLILLSSVMVARGGDAEPLQIGVAESEITPPLDFPMAGYYHERLATGQRDPLKAKAVVLRDGQQQAAFVITDLIGVSRDLYLEVRSRAAEKTGIPPEHIVVSATHSHTAPDYTRSVYQFLGQIKENNPRVAYADTLINGIVTAIVEAHQSTRPATLKAGSVKQQTPVSFNRRFLMKDGSVQTWQRLDNPNVIRAAGPIDPEIALLWVGSEDETAPRAVISNFALHLDTVGGTMWSADYPYFIEQSLRRKFGDELISVFATGTCGDINHVDPLATKRNSTEFIGNALAATIDSALPALTTVESGALNVQTVTLQVPIQEVTEEELERAQQLLPAAKAGEKVEFFDLVRAYKSIMLDHLRHDPPLAAAEDHINWGLSRALKGVGETMPLEVTTITVGADVALVFVPGEVFVDLGLAIKRGSPFRTTLVVELSNTVETIYIPTRAAYAQGSYEVINSTLERGGGEMLAEAALQLLHRAAQEQNR